MLKIFLGFSVCLLLKQWSHLCSTDKY